MPMVSDEETSQSEENILKRRALLALARFNFLIRSNLVGHSEEYYSAVSVLKFKYEKIDDATMEEVVNALKNEDTNIKDLTFETCKIGTEGAKAIADMLKFNSTLTVLDLSGNFIKNEGMEAISEAMRENTSLVNLVF